MPSNGPVKFSPLEGLSGFSSSDVREAATLTAADQQVVKLFAPGESRDAIMAEVRLLEIQEQHPGGPKMHMHAPAISAAAPPTPGEPGKR